MWYNDNIMIDLYRNSSETNASDSARIEAEGEHQDGARRNIETGSPTEAHEGLHPGHVGAADETPDAGRSEVVASQPGEVFVPAPETVLDESSEQIEADTDRILTGENKIDTRDSGTAKVLLDILNGEK